LKLLRTFAVSGRRGDTMGLAFKIAVRFLKSSKGQTVMIALGIAIGVSVQIFIGLLIQGLQQSLVDKTIGSSSQVTVTSENEDRLITDWKSKLKTISNTDNRIKSISVSADSSAFLKYGDKAEPVLVRGFIPEKAEPIYKLKASLYEGKLPVDNGQVIVGKELSELLGLKPGDTVEAVTVDGKQVKLEITGLYDFKVSSINKSWAIVNLETAQSFFGFADKVTSIEMQVSEVFNADETAIAVAGALGDSSLAVTDWKAQNQQLLSGLSGQNTSSIMIQVFVLVSVVLAIASVLAISVMQKSKQLGILKAMGLKDRNSSLVFMFQGLLLGIAGAILGIALGVGLLVMFTTFALNPDGTPVVPIYFNTAFIVFSGLIASVSAVLASLVPAVKSSKLSPIEVIKNG
jgi:lipoprotein-releasing system permease protein